jgi:hypothetical protein
MNQSVESLTIRQPGRPGAIEFRIGEQGPEIVMTGPMRNATTGELWCSTLKLTCGIRPTIEIGDPTGKPITLTLPPDGIVDYAHWERVWQRLVAWEQSERGKPLPE